MQKIIVRSIFILSILVLIIVGIVKIGKKSTVVEMNSFNAIPAGASFFFEIKDISAFLDIIYDDNLIWKELSEFIELKEFTNNVSFIDSILETNDKLQSFFGKNHTIISAHKMPNNTTNFLFINLQKESCEPDDFNKAVLEIFS